MSSDKVNQLFWLNFGQAVKDKAGADLGSSKVFFLATEAQKGPPAGDDIPDDYTYQGLYDIGNNLLATDNLFYNPSALHGYDEALQTFLTWVDLEGKPDTKIDAAMLQALKFQKAAQDNLKTQRDAAFAQFNEEKKLGLVINDNFYDYVAANNAPSYTAALLNNKNAAETIISLQAQEAGPMAPLVAADRAALRKGQDEEKDYPGYNMHGAMGNVLSPAELRLKFMSNEKIPPPVFQRLPAYNAPLYKGAVQAAMKKALTNFKPPNALEINIDLGKKTSDFQLGHTELGGSVGISNGWFSFNAGADHTKDSEKLETGDESSTVSVKMLYDTIQLIPITPGLWNFDVTKYKLKADAPKEVKTLARVTQLVVVTYLGYEITVGSKTASTIDAKMKETSAANGSLSVFGIPISLSGSGSNTTEHNTHTATWVNESKTLTVMPNSDTGFATVIGVVGEKFELKR